MYLKEWRRNGLEYLRNMWPTVPNLLTFTHRRTYSSESDCFSSGHKFSTVPRTQRLITTLKKWLLSELDKSSPQFHVVFILFRSTLILLSHIRVHSGLPSRFFPSDFPTEILYAFLIFTIATFYVPISSFRNCALVKLRSVCWIHLAYDKTPVSGFCEHGNEHLGSTNGRDVLSNWMTISFSWNILASSSASYANVRGSELGS
jgi:hypothetical protein